MRIAIFVLLAPPAIALDCSVLQPPYDNCARLIESPVNTFTKSEDCPVVKGFATGEFYASTIDPVCFYECTETPVTGEGCHDKVIELVNGNWDTDEVLGQFYSLRTIAFGDIIELEIRKSSDCGPCVTVDSAQQQSDCAEGYSGKSNVYGIIVVNSCGGVRRLRFSHYYTSSVTNTLRMVGPRNVSGAFASSSDLAAVDQGQKTEDDGDQMSTLEIATIAVGSVAGLVALVFGYQYFRNRKGKVLLEEEMTFKL